MGTSPHHPGKSTSTSTRTCLVEPTAFPSMHLRIGSDKRPRVLLRKIWHFGVQTLVKIPSTKGEFPQIKGIVQKTEPWKILTERILLKLALGEMRLGPPQSTSQPTRMPAPCRQGKTVSRDSQRWKRSPRSVQYTGSFECKHLELESGLDLFDPEDP